MTRLRTTLSFLVILLGGSLPGCGDAMPPAELDAAVDAPEQDAADDVTETHDAELPDAQSMSDASEDAMNDSGATDAAPDADDEEPLSIRVGHDRELRGVWIPSVFNISWPSRSGLSADDQRLELMALLDRAGEVGLNAIFLQVRPEGDALYNSTLEPWSRALTGTQGRDPGYDPLTFAINEAHARGLELHAWINPYRARAGSGSLHPTHAASEHPEWTVRYGDHLWFNPGLPAVRAHTIEVITEIIENYDVDGIHFDDYFYPYPVEGESFNDAMTYRRSGTTLSLEDWRRENVNTLVHEVRSRIEEVRSDVRFGISPFGIYRPGMPAGIRGLDAYADIYADSLAWMRNGDLDYIAPQLYWPTTQRGQEYETLLAWWAEQAAATGTWLFAGNYLSQLGTTSAWTLDEFMTQMRMTRRAHEAGARGNILYHVGPLMEDTLGVVRALGERNARPALPPANRGRDHNVRTPRVAVEGADILLPGATNLRGYMVYEQTEGVWQPERFIPAGEPRVTLYRGAFAITAVDRNDVESRGTLIDLMEGEPPMPPEPPAPEGLSCDHSLGGLYAHTACSPSYQCCDGAWRRREDGMCGECLCLETSGREGCGVE